MGSSGHFVQFFDTDVALVASVGRCIHESITADDTCIVIATDSQREQLHTSLVDFNLDPQALMAQYRYVALDARYLLATFMNDALPDRLRFHKFLGGLIRQAASRGQPVRIFAQMAAVLLEDGLADAVIELEELWNELSREHTFKLYCAYPSNAFGNDLSAKSYNHICAMHGEVRTN